ncbi:MAG TPA: LysR family transcriptional regulator [Acidisoma sp.]|uniref:LysR family transcriptional regulator n=1 Tax=Acidisoma sp. TaxID=1872115 RepID=UPI002BE19752|nr:LysR family transcriptional regulator [Acidisoma sp.]HTI01210.1 LysR family transcriptional regulator [Acidisoma sp.]
MRVTIPQLEAFYWTAQLGSALRAAAHLHISQPTISLRLKELAEAIGTPLLERTARGLRPTPEGRALLPRASAVIGEVTAMLGQAPIADVAGVIRVGLADGFAVTCLPPLLRALEADFPALRPEWVVTTSYMLEAALLMSTLDVAVMLNPIGDEQLAMQPLGSQPTTWAIPACWDIDATLTPAALAPRPVISNPPPSAMHRQIAGWFATAGLTPERLSICTSVPLIGELVAGGIGAGLLPRQMAERYAIGGDVRIMEASPPLENGRLFIGRRVGIADARIDAVAATLVRLLNSIGYLG